MKAKATPWRTYRLLFLLAIAVAMFTQAWQQFEARRKAAHRKTCINNLRIIERAKEEYTCCISQGAADDYVPTIKDLKLYLAKFGKEGMPVCPDGGTYSINAMTSRPTCSKSSTLGHVYTYGWIEGGGGRSR